MWLHLPLCSGETKRGGGLASVSLTMWTRYCILVRITFNLFDRATKKDKL